MHDTSGQDQRAPLERTGARPATRAHLGPVLWRQRVLVAVTCACGIAAALAVLLLPVRYSATASVLVQQGGVGAASVGGSDPEAEVLVDTEAQVVRSTPVADAVRRALGTTRDPEQLILDTSVAVSPDTTILRISHRAASPEAARLGADSFADEYLAYRTGQAREEVTARLEALERRVTALGDRTREVTRQLARAPRGSDLRADLRRELALLSEESDRIDAETLPLLTARTEAGSVVERAPLPSDPAGLPHPALALVLLLGVGACAVPLARWRDRHQDLVHDTADVEDLWGLEVAGTVSAPGLGDPTVQDYRRLLQAVRARRCRTLMLVGVGDDPASDHGARQLALGLAQLARRGGTPAAVLGAGAAGVALEGVEHVLPPPRLRAVLRRFAAGDVDHLTVIAAARSGPSADAWAIAPLVDLALIVVELHGSRHDEVRELAAKLELVGAPAVSAVVVAGAAAGGPVGVEERAASERPPRSSRPVAVGLLVASVVVAAGVGLRALTAGPPEDAASRAATTARGGDPDSGASRTRPRIRVAARANERGDLRVVERVLTERPVRRLRLAPPSHPLSDSAPRLIDLRLVSDGIPVAGPGSVTSAGLEVSLPSRSRRIRLSYWVVGAAAHSPQAPPGRVTMALGSTLRHDLPDLPVTTALSGVPILTLLCRDAPQDRQLCGLEKETGWRTTPLPAHRSAVVALADLPAP